MGAFGWSNLVSICPNSFYLSSGDPITGPATRGRSEEKLPNPFYRVIRELLHIGEKLRLPRCRSGRQIYLARARFPKWSRGEKDSYFLRHNLYANRSWSYSRVMKSAASNRCPSLSGYTFDAALRCRTFGRGSPSRAPSTPRFNLFRDHQSELDTMKRNGAAAERQADEAHSTRFFAR